MLGMKHVTLLIGTDGTCSIDAVNFADATCKTATQQIMQALAGQLVDERFKSEAQRLPPQAERLREGGQ